MDNLQSCSHNDAFSSIMQLHVVSQIGHDDQFRPNRTGPLGNRDNLPEVLDGVGDGVSAIFSFALPLTRTDLKQNEVNVALLRPKICQQEQLGWRRMLCAQAHSHGT